jgi:hypothetical protein
MLYIDLADQQPFASGGRRSCYIHPNDANKCIKINIRTSGFDDNDSEYKALTKHHRLISSTICPRCYGFCRTNLGKGLMLELYYLHTAKGRNIAPNVANYIKAHGKTTLLLDALDDFYDRLYHEAPNIKDILLHNLVVSGDAQQKLVIKLIDGYGNKHFIPLKTYIKPIRKTHIKRLINRFKVRYGLV